MSVSAAAIAKVATTLAQDKNVKKVIVTIIGIVIGIIILVIGCFFTICNSLSISDYLFDEKLISKISKEYRAYQIEINADVIMKKDTVKKRLTEVTKEIRNLITLVARIGSEMMADRISELETEKIHLEASLEQICFDESSKDISIETLTERFNQAKGFLKCGELKTTKKLIEQFVDKVLIFADHVEVVFNFHPDLILPQAHSTCGRGNLDIMHNNGGTYIGKMYNKNEISTCKQVDRLVEARQGKKRHLF